MTNLSKTRNLREMFAFDRVSASSKTGGVAGPNLFFPCTAWFATKLCFMNELGEPMIEKTDISVAADRICELSNMLQFSTKNFIPLMDS